MSDDVHPYRCKDCIYWASDGRTDVDGDLVGECRIRAPLLPRTPPDYGESYGEWPVTLDCHWCGEFSPKP